MKLCGAGSRLIGSNSPPLSTYSRQEWSDPNLAMDRLFELFPDKYPVLCGETKEAWTFRLDWPRQLLEPIDPFLREQARRCYGLELDQLANYVEIRRHGRADFLFSMFHSHALAVPALVMARDATCVLRSIVHVDAHHDLGASLLTWGRPKRLVNPAFDIECSLDDAESVMQSVGRGFIHKGCFLTAFVSGMLPGQLFHVHAEVLPDQFWLQRVSSSIQIGAKTALRDSVAFERTPIPNAWQLIESPFLPPTLQINRTDGVWLDVDLDAFCNRFDGDSDHHELSGSRQELHQMEERIAGFLNALGNSSWLRNVVAVSVAASPGFFPSEYWENAIPTLCDGVAKALGDA